MIGEIPQECSASGWYWYELDFITMLAQCPVTWLTRLAEIEALVSFAAACCLNGYHVDSLYKGFDVGLRTTRGPVFFWPKTDVDL